MVYTQYIDVAMFSEPELLVLYLVLEQAHTAPRNLTLIIVGRALWNGIDRRNILNTKSQISADLLILNMAIIIARKPYVRVWMDFIVTNVTIRCLDICCVGSKCSNICVDNAHSPFR